MALAKPPEQLPTVSQLKDSFNYDPETGKLTWKYHPDKPKFWNTRWVGKVAGSIDDHGHLRVRLKPFGSIKVHRLIWAIHTNEWPKNEIDHIDRDGSNNVISNLREATGLQNRYNVGKRSHSTNPFKGINKLNDGRKKKWRAAIGSNNKRIRLGTFYTPEEAHNAYCKAALELYGEFASFE